MENIELLESIINDFKNENEMTNEQLSFVLFQFMLDVHLKTWLLDNREFVMSLFAGDDDDEIE